MPSGLMRCILPFLTVTSCELAGVGFVADGDVELAVGAEVDVAAVVLLAGAVCGELKMIVGLQPTPLFSTKRATRFSRWVAAAPRCRRCSRRRCSGCC